MYRSSEDAKRKVYETFGTNKEMVEEDVNIIKTWLKTQPHLPEIMEDVKIKNFLNLCKYSIEKTKQKIDMYYTIRTLIPDFFEKSNPKLGYIQQLLDTTYLSTFPDHLDDVHTIYFVKQKAMNTIHPVNFLNTWFAIYEMRLSEDFMVNDIIVYDMINISFADFRKVTPTLMANFIRIYEKVYSLRLKSVIYINCPSFFPLLAQLLRSVLKPKIFERVQFHENENVLKEILPKDFIPKDYGGEGPTLEELNGMILKKLVEHQDRFDQLDKLQINEALRPEKLNNDEILGYYGNFKKLNVD